MWQGYAKPKHWGVKLQLAGNVRQLINTLSLRNNVQKDTVEITDLPDYVFHEKAGGKSRTDGKNYLGACSA
jgi:hypothetical protein